MYAYGMAGSPFRSRAKKTIRPRPSQFRVHRRGTGRVKCDVVEVREVRRLCYGFARRTGGILADFRVPTVTPNFWQAVIEYPDRRLSVVAANDVPVVALARPRAFAFAPARE
ncbi:hypothetical protein GCM10027360_45570 [Amycolatopsis echigonensis]